MKIAKKVSQKAKELLFLCLNQTYKPRTSPYVKGNSLARGKNTMSGDKRESLMDFNKKMQKEIFKIAKER